MKMSYTSNYFKVITVLATLMFYYVSCSNSTENSRTTTENTNVAKTNPVQNVIWPGDADNNGVVSTEDILSIGLKYNKRGKERAENQRNTRFEKYTSIPWGEKLPNEADISHIDCDGNGVINAADVQAIKTNFTKTHTNNNSSFEGANTILMKLEKTDSIKTNCDVKNDSTFCYKITYDMDFIQEQNIYGANFMFNYQLKTKNTKITINDISLNTCLGTTEGKDFISIIKQEADDKSDNKFNIYIGLTRINPDEVVPPCKSLGAITMEIEEVVFGGEDDLAFKLNPEAETENIASFINGDVITFSNIKIVR